MPKPSLYFRCVSILARTRIVIVAIVIIIIIIIIIIIPLQSFGARFAWSSFVFLSICFAFILSFSVYCIPGIVFCLFPFVIVCI